LFLEVILKTYSDMDGKPLTEIFLHCRSSISRDEFEGFKEACPPDCKLVGAPVKTDRYGPHLYRNGAMPVLRGTLRKTSERSGLLYASGFHCRKAFWPAPRPAPQVQGNPRDRSIFIETVTAVF
jgi:hypothetical protein